VQEMMRRREVALDFDSLRIGRGRVAEANAVLRVGARALADLLGPSDPIGIVDIVDTWCAERAELATSYYLTETVLPAWLATRQVVGSRRSGKADPVYLRSDRRLAVCLPELASWWANRGVQGMPDRGRALQLGGLDALRAETKAMGLAPATPDMGKRWHYLDQETSWAALDRAGKDPGAEIVNALGDDDA
jgi:hypothetical protein